MAEDETRESLLREILVGRQNRDEAPEELYGDLKTEVFKARFRGDDVELFEPARSQDVAELTRTYIPKRCGVAETTAETDSQLSKVKAMQELYHEDPSFITYEHLFAARICEPHANILLVGPTGSGKTHKMEYVWYKYLSKLEHCQLHERCRAFQRLRFRLGVDVARCESPMDFYKLILEQVYGAMETRLNGAGTPELPMDYVWRCYQKYVAALYAAIRQGAPSPVFFEALREAGMSETDPKTFKGLLESAKNDLRVVRFVVLAVLQFCGWVVRHLCGRNHQCLFVVFDNVDGAPPEIQKTLVDLLLDTRPTDSALLVCACRAQTLNSWGPLKANVLDLIYHKGPTALDVVIARLSDFIQRHPSPEADAPLKALLKGRPPSDFMQNLVRLKEAIQSDRLREDFEDYFGQLIRSGLLVAQNIVDAAAHRAVDEYAAEVRHRSFYAVERMIFRPWGLNSMPGHIPNVLALVPMRSRRLAGVRILRYLLRRRTMQPTLGELGSHMQLFGVAPAETLALLNALIREGLVLAQKQDPPKLETYNKNKDEAMQLTDVGIGLYKHCFDYNYVSTMMFFVPALPRPEYPLLLSGDLNQELPLTDTLQVLRGFLQESTEVELEELKPATGRNRRNQYLREYGALTICHRMYTRVLEALVKITRGEFGGRVFDLAAQRTRLIKDDLTQWTSRVAKQFKVPEWTPDDELQSLLAEVDEMAGGNHSPSKTETKSDGGGGVPGGMTAGGMTQVRNSPHFLDWNA
jgi:hypothetical protein